MLNIDDGKLYRRCHKKQFEMWMCMPPYGTVIINRMEQYDLLCKLRTVIPELKSREFLTPDELLKIKNSNIQLYNFITNNAYVINKTMNVVLCGTEGELWATTYAFACNQYQMYHNEGYYNIPNVINTRVKLVNNQYLMDWCKVRTTKLYSNNQTMALFVPVRNQFCLQTSQGVLQKGNQTGVSHGKGDFIVCECVNGVANLQNRWIVNGLVFADTYNNRGWEDNITVAVRHDIAPKPVFTVKDEFKFTKSFVSQLEGLYVNSEFTTVQRQANAKNVAVKVKSGITHGLEFGAVLKVVDATCKYVLLFAGTKVNGVVTDFESIDDLFSRLENIIVSNDSYKKYYNNDLYYIKCYAKRYGLKYFLKALSLLKDVVDDLTIRNLRILFTVLEKYIKEHSIEHNWTINDSRCADTDFESKVFSLELEDSVSSSWCIVSVSCCDTKHINFFANTVEEWSKYFEEPYEYDISVTTINNVYSTFCDIMSELSYVGSTDEFLSLYDIMKTCFDEESLKIVLNLSFLRYNYQNFARYCELHVRVYKIVAEKLGLKHRLSLHARMLEANEDGRDSGVYSFSVVFNCVDCNIKGLECIVITLYSDTSNPDYSGFRQGGTEHYINIDTTVLDESDIMYCIRETVSLSEEELSKLESKYASKKLQRAEASITVVQDKQGVPQVISFQHRGSFAYVPYNEFTCSFLFRNNSELLSEYGITRSTVSDDKLLQTCSCAEANAYYDSIVPFFDEVFDKIAYRVSRSECFDDVSIPNAVVNVDYEDKRTGYVYLSMNKWGSSDKAYFVLTASSLYCLEYSFPSMVTRETRGKVAGAKYNRIHYHNLLIRLGLFSHVIEFKKLKMLFIKLNEEVFDSLAPHDLVVIAMGYAVNTQCDEDCSAYYTERNDRHNARSGMICMNADYFSLQNRISKEIISVLLHEMCHACTKAKYGSCQELVGEDGGTLYGISKEYEIHFWCHGKRFNEFVEIATQRNKYGLSRGDIFSYGVGHPVLRAQDFMSLVDNRTLTLAEKNVFNLGQKYRRIDTSELYSVDSFCKRCGSFGCNCESPDLITINSNEYVGVCVSCGKMHVFNESNVFEDRNISTSYFDSIDRIGAVAMRKCSCGGRLIPQIPSMCSNADYIKSYMEDFKYCQRLKNHIMHYVNNVMDKHNNYFKSKMGCELQVTAGKMPFIEFDLVGDCFKEMYKLFIAHSDSGRTVGRLYRDYGIEAKGYLIHTFMLNSNKDISKFLDYLVTYIRRNSREITPL